MKNRHIVQQFWFARSNYNSKAISTYCDNSDALSQDQLRVVSSAQRAILYRKSSDRQLK